MAAKKQSVLAKVFSDNGKGVVTDTSWLQADEKLLVQLIDICNNCGCAPSFSITRDGGAWKVYYLHEEIPVDARSRYCGANDDVDGFLAEQIEIWQGVLDDQKRS